MKKNRAEQIENILVFGFGIQILLHLYLSFSNLMNGIDKGYGHSYPLRSYVLIGVYLLIVLASDIFILWRRNFELSEVLRKYWGSACIASIIVMLLYVSALKSDAITALGLFYTPFMVLAPYLEVLRMPVYGDASLFSVAVIGVFCLFNWAVCRFAGEKGSAEQC